MATLRLAVDTNDPGTVEYGCSKKSCLRSGHKKGPRNASMNSEEIEAILPEPLLSLRVSFELLFVDRSFV